MPVELESIVPWGRSFDEYVRMFALTEADLAGHVLDCAAGPSSFHAELRARGGRVVSVDPIYALSAEDIRRRVEAVRDDMMGQVRRQPGQFNWEFICSPDHLEQVRMGAMGRFLDDFAGDPPRDRYRPQSLPTLDFAEGTFDLALCSHCLFLYSDRLDEAFHVDSVRELVRVARELRIFPVADLAGRDSPHLAAVRDQFLTERVRVQYEFLRGANEMLVVTGAAPAPG
jgi:SAM-dependent methyltransferase